MPPLLLSCTDAVVINPSADGLSKVYYNKGKCDSKKSKVGPYPLGSMCVHMAPEGVSAYVFLSSPLPAPSCVGGQTNERVDRILLFR